MSDNTLQRIKDATEMSDFPIPATNWKIPMDKEGEAEGQILDLAKLFSGLATIKTVTEIYKFGGWNMQANGGKSYTLTDLGIDASNIIACKVLSIIDDDGNLHDAHGFYDPYFYGKFGNLFPQSATGYENVRHTHNSGAAQTTENNTQHYHLPANMNAVGRMLSVRCMIDFNGSIQAQGGVSLPVANSLFLMHNWNCINGGAYELVFNQPISTGSSAYPNKMIKFSGTGDRGYLMIMRNIA